MSKICDNCGKTVDDGVKFCPHCKSQSFRPNHELTMPSTDFVHRLFYWRYPEGHVMSKSKIGSLIVFITFATLALGAFPAGMIFVSLVIAVLVFLIGFALHFLVKKPSKVKIINNDYGLKTDLVHMFFYWQNNEGYFALSKTKTISIVIFILSIIFFSFFNPPSLFALVLAGFMFSIPAFIIGFAIHKLTNPNPKAKEIPPKKEVKKVQKTQREEVLPQKSIVPEYLDYKKQLEDLNSKFMLKEKATREIIEKRFEPPQLTYTRFIGGVDKSSKLFKKHYDSALTMIELDDDYSPRIASEIESKITILQSIIDKLEDLANELLLADDLSRQEDIDNLVGEMDDLIDSVKNYE